MRQLLIILTFLLILLVARSPIPYDRIYLAPIDIPHSTLIRHPSFPQQRTQNIPSQPLLII
jgi:hypothetical protein